MYSNIYVPQDNLLQVTPSTGGYCNLFAIPLQHVATWPVVNPQTGLIDELPGITPGYTWLGIENMPGNAIYKEEEQESNAGTWFSMSITAPLADDNHAQVLRALTLRFNQLVILLWEPNGMVRLLGSSDCGAVLRQTYSSADEDGTRQRLLTINWEADNNAILVHPAALESIEFSTQYSYEFL